MNFDEVGKGPKIFESLGHVLAFFEALVGLTYDTILAPEGHHKRHFLKKMIFFGIFGPIWGGS